MSDGVFTKLAPQPIGPYRQAVRSGTLLFCSGQIPVDPATSKLVEGDVAVQARRAVEVTAVLA